MLILQGRCISVLCTPNNCCTDTSGVGDYLYTILQVKIVLSCTLCYRGEITSGYIIVQVLPGQLHQVGEYSVIRCMFAKNV